MLQVATIVDPSLVTMGVIVPKAYYRYTIPSTPANIIPSQIKILNVEYVNQSSIESILSIPNKRLPLLKLLPLAALSRNYHRNSSCHMCHNKKPGDEILKCTNHKIRFNRRINKIEFEQRIHSSRYVTNNGKVKRTPYSYNQLCRYGYCLSCLKNHFHYTNDQFRNAKISSSWKCFICTKQCTCTKCRRRNTHKPQLIHLEQK